MNEYTIAFQHEFCQELPYKIKATKEYKDYQATFHWIDIILNESEIETELYHYLQSIIISKRKRKKAAEKTWQLTQQIVRLGIARKLRGESLRNFSCSLAESVVLQRFCRLVGYGAHTVSIPGKSALADYEKIIPKEIMDNMIVLLLAKAQKKNSAHKFGLQESISLADCYLDSTCVEANIHYPVDWVLFKDAARSLMKAVITIRKKGLKNRMAKTPGQCMQRMNNLAIKMSYAGRMKNGKKKRKAIVRLMKKLIKVIGQHALKHRIILEERWEETDLGEGEKDQIVKRIDNVLEQLPAVITLVHKRIISEQKIPNADKLLSLYEKDIHVVVRKKSGKEVEFGNVFSLMEQKNGLIIDYAIYKDKAPADAKILKERVANVEDQFGKGAIKQLTTDRGFNSITNKKYLLSKKIIDNTCPRKVDELAERAHDEVFMAHQRRRGQTEARIGIFKNVFLGKPFRNKGFDYREGGLCWCVLAHNLWALARMSMKNQVRLAETQRAA